MRKKLVFFLIASMIFAALALLATYQVICSGIRSISPTCRNVRTPLVRLMPDRLIPTPIPTLIPPGAIPEGVMPNALLLPTSDRLPLPSGKSGGYMSFVGTWVNKASGDNSLFRVEMSSPFVGQFQLGAYYLDPIELLFTCMIDYVQTPCSPSTEVTQSISPSYGEDIVLPIKIADLEQGLHELTVIFWMDPYAYQDAPDSASRIDSQFQLNGLRASLAVGGDTTTPDISYPTLSSSPSAAFGIDGVVLSDKEDPLDERGAVQYTTYLVAQAGEPFNVFLHLNNRNHVGIDYAIVAFINYKQVPILLEGKTRLPLYTHVKARAWEVTSVEIVAPMEAGHYELQVVGIMLPYARMDLAGPDGYGKYIDYPLPVFFQASTRIDLDVHHKQ
jgi:hypothetical protein